MGQKGDKHTSESQKVSELLEEKLKAIQGITSKKMFGGHGIFHDGKMFAMINSKGQSFLKTDDAISSEFEALGGKQHGKMPYHSIPDPILSDNERLMEWVSRSIKISKL
ncbi:MAG: TfoX/Sxy family protein [Bacteroidia bacterium]|nr:TfoX/Sxy family protein [Bacteroidia bacterium]NND26367.1 TfoX/Sxy family protein [Flavobacteriaceae bacterium]MBT8278489.1 TfoX/Sxy family protein [Bacteroidia bacterium]NNK60230.1 TfoX/Sxy family protein [Flavobacteriaceae bacterium]NNL31693.1 TfoX/Sxy family protein [Flavobacteriaceae bacterium]